MKTEFNISENINPILIELIINTESMNDTERQYWLDLIPSMTSEQVDRLFNILETEKRKLEELELINKSI